MDIIQLRELCNQLKLAAKKIKSDERTANTLKVMATTTEECLPWELNTATHIKMLERLSKEQCLAIYIQELNSYELEVFTNCLDIWWRIVQIADNTLMEEGDNDWESQPN